MIRRGHLRLLPKPLAKPAPYPVRPDGVDVQRVAEDAYVISRQSDGRIVEIRLTREEMAWLLFRVADLVQAWKRT